MRYLTFIGAILALSYAVPASAEATLKFDPGKEGPRLSPLQHGIFFEEINHAGDGGIYGEMVQNPFFRDGVKAWQKVEEGGAKTTLTPVEGGVRVTIEGPAGARGGLSSDGFWGIGLATNTRYLCTVYVPKADASSLKLEAKVGEEASPQSIALRRAAVANGEFDEFSGTMNATQAAPMARLVLTVAAPADFVMRGVSFERAPARPRARTLSRSLSFLRPDLARKVSDMKPSFIRFPGGCFVEGNKMANAFRWKTTIGPREQRPGHWNLWGYQSTDGLGYLEYLEWCENIGAEPLFVINCGMAHEDLIPMDKMGEYVQDALDAIEFANGDVNTTWGARRAALGHPRPFNLRMMEIGNENGGPAYEERYALFYDAIKKRYPEMMLIANVPVRSRPMDIVDEHYYLTPQAFVRQANRYDAYPRTGPKIYVGEYAVTQGCGQGNLIAALGEAYFVTGMERNADVVRMSSYAPLFVNVNNRAWNPDAIVFDSTRSFGTPSYWAQVMASMNRGDTVVPCTMEGAKPAVKESPGGAVGIGTWATSAEFADLKVTSNGKTLWSGDSTTSPLKAGKGQWTIENGTARQTSMETDCRAVGGDTSWTDYTYTLRARKLGGAEGFLVMFRVKDQGNWYWWNIGGWGNTRHNIEHSIGGQHGASAKDVGGSIETGRWYNIRVDAKGDRVRCYLDNKLIHDWRDAESSPLAAVITRDDLSKDLLVKVVNIGAEPQAVKLDFPDRYKYLPIADITVLTSGDPNDENSFENPRKVAPVSRTIDGVKPGFAATFPPYSYSIVRLKARP